MNKLLFLSIIIGWAQIAAGQIQFYKKVSLPVKTTNEVFFDCKYPWVITGDRKFYNMKIYVQNIEANTCDSFVMETPTMIRSKEMGLDIEIISPDTFYLLTSERLLKIGHRGSTYTVQEVKSMKGYSKNLGSYNDQVYTIASFTPNPKKAPKINIESAANGKTYSHFVKCDPHAIFGGYYPVSLSSNGIFCVVEDNLHPSLTFLNSKLEKIRSVVIHSKTTPTYLTEKACEFDKKYTVFGSQEMFDSMNYYLNKIPTIESVFFIDTNKVLVVATETGPVDLDPFMQVITLDAQWNIIGRQSLNPSPLVEDRSLPFDPKKIPFNPYGMRVKTDDNLMIVRTKCVDFDKLKTNSEYHKYYNATMNKDCYYLYKTK